jgi:ribosomal-protein-alanine N-acetyltransferase
MERVYTISPMTEKDIDSVLMIEHSLFTHPWSKDFFRLVLSDINNYMVTMKSGGAVVGYGGYHLLKGRTDFLPIKKHRNIIHLINLAVQQDAQGQGLGARLLNILFCNARSMGAEYCYLEVRPSNEYAFSFYRKSGFSIIGMIENYYPREKEDAYVLGKDITQVDTV